MENNIESIKKRIEYLNGRLKKCNSSIEAAVISDKLLAAKKQLNQLGYHNNTKEVNDQIDAPMLVDKIDHVEHILQRGQVVGSSSVCSIEI